MIKRDLQIAYKIVKDNEDNLKKCALYGSLGLIAVTHIPMVLMGACLGIGFWTSRKLTDKIDEKIALSKLDKMDKAIDEHLNKVN